MNCGTWFPWHLAALNLSVWEEIAGGRTTSSGDFWGPLVPGHCRVCPCSLWLGLFLSGAAISAASHCGAGRGRWVGAHSLNQHPSCV